MGKDVAIDDLDKETAAEKQRRHDAGRRTGAIGLYWEETDLDVLGIRIRERRIERLVTVRTLDLDVYSASWSNFDGHDDIDELLRRAVVVPAKRR